MNLFLSLLKKIVPWAVAGGVLYWLFTMYPPAQILASLRLANLWGVAAISIAYFVTLWILDTYCVAYHLTRFVHRIGAREIFPIRAASYPVSVVNYGAGQATFAYYVARLHTIRAGDIIGIFTLITAADLFWVITLAFVGSFIGEHHILGINITPTVRTIGIVYYGLTAAHLVFWLMHWENRLRGPRWQRAFAWLRKKQLFRIFHEAALRDYLILAAWRLPLHVLLILTMYCTIHFFQGHVPLLMVIGNVPIAILIGVIPISWSGVGTANKALIDLLAPHLTAIPVTAGLVSAAELVLAVSLIWMFGNYVCKILVGLLYLPKIQKTSKKQYIKKSSSSAV